MRAGTKLRKKNTKVKEMPWEETIEFIGLKTGGEEEVGETTIGSHHIPLQQLPPFGSWVANITRLESSLC